MKKICLLIALLLPVVAFADNITAEKAQSYAAKFLGAKLRTATQTVRLVSDSEKITAAKKFEKPAYYIFNASDGGFVIISAEDAVSPVLAYSYDNTFVVEGMPDNISYWMDQLRTEILKVRESKATASPKVKAEWEMLASAGVTPSYASDEMKLETALWNQSSPYNDLCPTVDGSKAPSGCVATATGIVMRYHKWPEAGHGTLPDYRYADGSGKTQKGHKLGNTYDWDNMPLSYKSGQYTEEQAAQVAQLLYDVGIMAQMMYYGGSSGTVTAWSATGLEKYMYYDPSITYEAKGTYSDGQWLDKIKKELKEVGPVVYDGQSSSGGHAFVIDGYDKSNKVSVNWGWGGNSNGYFDIASMNGFSSRCGAIFNMKPENGGKSADTAFSYYDMYIKDDFVVPDKQFVVYMGTMETLYRDGAYDIAIGHFDAKGKLKEVASEIYRMEEDDLPVGYFMSEGSFDECIIKEKLAAGDYLKPIYRLKETDPFVPAIFNSDDKGHETITLDLPVIKCTSMEYDANDRLVTLTTNLDGKPSFTLNNSKGTAVKDGVSTSGNSFIIDRKVVPSGQYTISITVDWSTQSFTFTL